MDPIKAENFRKIHDRQFPMVRNLSPEECESLRKKLRRSFNLDDTLDGLGMLRKMEAISASVDVDPSADAFSLSRLLDQYRIPFADLAFINWDRFTRIDELKLSELSTYFTDLWYPSVDDIEIFDHSCQWFVMIRHWCAVTISFVDHD